jgi:16S rRNA (guanine527-N7)-methyltransferase
MSTARAEAGLDAIASAIGVPLDARSRQRLLAYLALLQRWNRTYNLTAVRDPGQMLIQHVADSLAVVPPLLRWLGGRSASLLDAGSGGGLPGAIIAMVCPEVVVTCSDTVGKKAAFVRQVSGELELPNLHAEHGRVERGSGRFDIVTSRAFATLSDFCKLTRHRLMDGGVWLAMKGRRPDDEIHALPGDIEVFHVEPLQVPGLGAQRCLVWLRPRA